MEYPAPKSSTPTIQLNFLISEINFDTSLKSEISSDSKISNSKNWVQSLFCSNISYINAVVSSFAMSSKEILTETLLFLFFINLKEDRASYKNKGAFFFF